MICTVCERYVGTGSSYCRHCGADIAPKRSYAYYEDSSSYFNALPAQNTPLSANGNVVPPKAEVSPHAFNKWNSFAQAYKIKNEKFKGFYQPRV